MSLTRKKHKWTGMTFSAYLGYQQPTEPQGKHHRQIVPSKIFKFEIPER